VRALRASPSVLALQATGAWALWGLLRPEAGDALAANAALAAVNAGAARALADALTLHGDSLEVVQSAAGALLALAQAGGEAGKAAVSAVKGVRLIRGAMAAHPSVSFRGEFDGLRGWLRAERKAK
jgi:hypothetical protein